LFINERYLCEHFIANVDPMRVVFCSGEDEFRWFDDSRVEIDWAGQVQIQRAGEMLLNEGCGMFYIGEVARIEEVIDGYELPENIWACLVFVIVGLYEWPDVTYEVDLPDII
jgi:hypothetical protein